MDWDGGRSCFHRRVNYFLWIFIFWRPVTTTDNSRYSAHGILKRTLQRATSFPLPSFNAPSTCTSTGAPPNSNSNFLAISLHSTRYSPFKLPFFTTAALSWSHWFVNVVSGKEVPELRWISRLPIDSQNATSQMELFLHVSVLAEAVTPLALWMTAESGMDLIYVIPPSTPPPYAYITVALTQC